MNAQIRLHCRVALHSRLFGIMAFVMAFLAFFLTSTMRSVIVRAQCSFFEVTLYGLSHFHGAIWGYVPLFLIAISGQLVPGGADVYIIPRCGAKAYALSRCVCLLVQALVTALAMVVGIAVLSLLCATPLTNAWSVPGLFLMEGNPNEYYVGSLLFTLAPAGAAGIQLLLLVLWLYAAALTALLFCTVLADVPKGLAATIGLHLMGLALYYLPTNGGSLLTYFDSFFLYEYLRDTLPMSILRTVLILLACGAGSVLAVVLMKRFRWEKIGGRK